MDKDNETKSNKNPFADLVLRPESSNFSKGAFIHVQHTY